MAQVFNKDHWSGPALFVIVNAILNGLNNLDTIFNMCVGHAVVCMRDQEIFVWGGGGGGEPASTQKGRYFLYIVSRGKVRTSIPMETYSTCDFRGGERVRSLTDFTGGGGGWVGGCSITCRGVVSVQYSYGKL